MRFAKHFHGWHDHVAFGVKAHLDGTPTVGVLPDVAVNVILVKPNDVAGVERVLAENSDVAALMIEPIGASSGAVPTSPAVLRELREITRRHGVLLIFDEVVTGFRVAPGGVQALHGVVPDLTTLAKIVAGGMPGGAVAGSRKVLDWLDFEASAAAGRERIAHEGTHNAHPVSAAAGIATLKVIRDTDACARASAAAAKVRAGMNEILEEEGVPWAVYGVHSFFNFYTNPENREMRPTTFNAEARAGRMVQSRQARAPIGENAARDARLRSGSKELARRHCVVCTYTGRRRFDARCVAALAARSEGGRRSASAGGSNGGVTANADENKGCYSGLPVQVLDSACDACGLCVSRARAAISVQADTADSAASCGIGHGYGGAHCGSINESKSGTTGGSGQ